MAAMACLIWRVPFSGWDTRGKLLTRKGNPIQHGVGSSHSFEALAPFVEKKGRIDLWVSLFGAVFAKSGTLILKSPSK